MKETSSILREIGGVLLVQMQSGPRLYCIEDLEYVNELSIGQMFNAVCIYAGKTPKDYGDLWPHYRIQSGERANEVSEKFKTINSVLQKRSNDLERFKLVFAQLQEEFPTILTKEKTQERLDTFNSMIEMFSRK